MSIFDKIILPKLRRSTFNLSHDVKLTGEFGKLIPFMCEEVVPGDTWYNKSDVLIRFAPMIAPVMHKINVYTHFFYVPFRLVWDDAEEFFTGGKDGTSNPGFPRLPLLHNKSKGGDFADTFGLFAPGSLADYLNYPTSDSNMGNAPGMLVSALPFRMYQLIYNEYYRDENLEEEIEISHGSEIMTQNVDLLKPLLTLRTRAWRKDYFSSALPWTQKGPTQLVPVTTVGQLNNTDIGYKGSSKDGYASEPVFMVDKVTGNTYAVGANGALVTGDGVAGPRIEFSGAGSSPSVQGYDTFLDNSRNLEVKDGKVTIDGSSFTINDLRRSNRIQKYLEARARGGSRFAEWLLSIYGVKSDDLRLMRPEYLGGGMNPVQVSDVLQTSQTSDSSPQGQYSGIGFSFGSSNSFKKTFKEPGYIMGIMSVMPEPGYTEGCPRSYAKYDPYDFFIPQFSELGEQDIYNYELALRGGDPYETFGYAPRYAEYKYIPSRIHGDFKNMNGLGFWTLNRHYQNQPQLSNEFIKCDVEKDDLNRIFAVTDSSEQHLFVQIHNTTKARRPMPYLPDPSL